MKCRMKRVASLFLALALCAGMTMNVGAVTVQEAENKADELEGKKEQAEAEAKDLTEKLKGIVADMEETQKKLTEKEEEIEQVENELVQAQIDANDQYERLKVRIKYMYESGNTQFVAVLAESKNMGDFLNKAEYISQVQKYMNYIDKNVKEVSNNSTIGILICKKENRFVIEYCSFDSIVIREYEFI